MKLEIKTSKGTAVSLEMAPDGKVTATANGTAYVGTNSLTGVALYGSKTGDYLQLAEGIAAIIATPDLRAAKAFFETAKTVAHDVLRAAHLAQHAARLSDDPAYAAEMERYAAESKYEGFARSMEGKYSKN